jgi:hypothetical protein
VPLYINGILHLAEGQALYIIVMFVTRLASAVTKYDFIVVAHINGMAVIAK